MVPITIYPTMSTNSFALWQIVVSLLDNFESEYFTAALIASQKATI
jgi:hypothetical protein